MIKVINYKFKIIIFLKIIYFIINDEEYTNNSTNLNDTRLIY